MPVELVVCEVQEGLVDESIILQMAGMEGPIDETDESVPVLLERLDELDRGLPRENSEKVETLFTPGDEDELEQ